MCSARSFGCAINSSRSFASSLTVRPRGQHFELYLGARRLRAAKIADLETIPAIVRDLDDDQVLEVQLIENVQRDDLTELEEGDTYALLLERGKSAEEIAARAGKSKGYVYGRVKLASLPKSVREKVDAGKITPSVGVLIARIHDPKRQEQAARELIE